jgi:hypothetical protein
VTKPSPVRAHKSHGDGWGVSLTCSACEEYDRCGKKQDPPVQVPSVHPTDLVCWYELLKRPQDRHVDCPEAVAKKAAVDVTSTDTVDADTPNVLQAMMKFEQTKAHAKTTNKVVLEEDHENGDEHDLITEFDNCDLIDHRRERTRVQNRRNVQVGSRDNQQKPSTGKDGFLHHTCLGLVGWISYWC